MMQRFSPEQIVNTVCKILELDVDKFRSKLRETKYADGRFIAAYLIRVGHQEKQKLDESNKDSTYKNLTELFNRKLNVIYDEQRKCKFLMQSNKEFRTKYELVYRSLTTQEV